MVELKKTSIDDATDSEKYPHTEKIGRGGWRNILSLALGKISETVFKNPNPREEIKFEPITMFHEQGQKELTPKQKEEQNEQWRAFANLTGEKQQALEPFAKQLTSKQIATAGTLPIKQIKVLDNLIVKLTLEQTGECREVNPEILAKYRDALEKIKPEEKVEDIIPKQIIIAGWSFSINKIEMLGDLFLKFTPKQVEECEKFRFGALVECRDALEKIKPEEKVEDIIENTYKKKEALEK